MCLLKTYCGEFDVSKIEYKGDINFSRLLNIVRVGEFEFNYENKNICFINEQKYVEKYDLNNELYNKTISYKEIKNENELKKIEFSTKYNNSENNNSNGGCKNLNFKKTEYIFLTKYEFTNFLIKIFQDWIKLFCQHTRQNEKSIKYFNFGLFRLIVPFVFAMLIIGFTTHKISEFFASLIVFYFIMCILIKSFFLFFGTFLRLKNDKVVLKENDITLPKYTILIPMFHENKNTIAQSINAIKSLKYPKIRLDVKLVLEEDDNQTREVLNKVILPKWVTPVWCPYFQPRTKPKACNIATLFAEGEFVVIYDAEDIPDSNQLLLAVQEFKKNKNIDILQGCLSFYNYSENLLTECFNLEYSVWFRIIMQSFSLFGITIPLGGTTNHIRFNFLKKHSFWDSYNVTEDLELSIVACKYKNKIKFLNSDTKEWCVIDLKSWFKQRTRWLKGYFIATFLYCFDFRVNHNIFSTIFIQVAVGFSALSFLLAPIFFFSITMITNKFLLLLWIFCSYTYSFTYVFLYLSICKNKSTIITKQTLISFLVYPLYFTLHSISAWIAFFDLIFRPYYWSKTKHNC